MNWTLEVVVVPVSDVDRACTFYEAGLGFRVDHDTRMGETRRIVQLTPPGSGCSIVIGTGLTGMPPARFRACNWWSATYGPPTRNSWSAGWRSGRFR